MNFAASAMNESAYALIAVVNVVKVLDDEAKVPVAIDASKRVKKGCDREVTWRDPWAFQTSSASYNCSATAKVARYHGYLKLS